MQMRIAGATALALGALFVGASPALGSGGGNDTSAKLRKAVSVDGVRLHQGALARTATGGNRLAGTRGFDLSADYVDLQARLAGLSTRRHEFEYDLDELGRLQAARARRAPRQALHPRHRRLDLRR